MRDLLLRDDLPLVHDLERVRHLLRGRATLGYLLRGRVTFGYLLRGRVTCGLRSARVI